MTIFFPRPCSTISASTVTPATVGRPTSTLPPSSAKRSGPKVTLVPAGPASFSTRRVSPSLTRYCFPPVAMTAYMVPGPPGERGSLERRPALSSSFGTNGAQAAQPSLSRLSAVLAEVEGRPEHAGVGDDGVDETRRGDVEDGVSHRDPGRDQAPPRERGNLVRSALLD